MRAAAVESVRERRLMFSSELNDEESSFVSNRSGQAPRTEAQDENGQMQKSTQSFFPYSIRAMFTFVCIEMLVFIGLILSYFLVLPDHPFFVIGMVIFPCVITVALHNTLTLSTLPRYDICLDKQVRHLRLNDARSRHTSVSNIEVDGDRQNVDPNLIADQIPLCHKCGKPRPERTHHCRKCARCIPRMSHHCAVLGVCLGAHNLKPFILLCAYGSMATFLVLMFSVTSTIHQLFRLFYLKRSFSFYLFLRFEGVYIMFTTSISLLVLFVYHVTLVARNFTLLEGLSQNSSWSLGIPCLKQSIVSPYHTGSAVSNLRQVFGTGFSIFVPAANVQRIVDTTEFPSTLTSSKLSSQCRPVEQC